MSLRSPWAKRQVCAKTSTSLVDASGQHSGQSLLVTEALTHLDFKCSFSKKAGEKKTLKFYCMENITNSLKIELMFRVPTEKHSTDNWAFVGLCYLIYE